MSRREEMWLLARHIQKIRLSLVSMVVQTALGTRSWLPASRSIISQSTDAGGQVHCVRYRENVCNDRWRAQCLPLSKPTFASFWPYRGLSVLSPVTLINNLCTTSGRCFTRPYEPLVRQAARPLREVYETVLTISEPVTFYNQGGATSVHHRS